MWLVPCGWSRSGTGWLLVLLSLGMLRTFPKLPRVNPEEIILVWGCEITSSMRLSPASSWTVFPKGILQKVNHRCAALSAAHFGVPFVLIETIDWDKYLTLLFIRMLFGKLGEEIMRAICQRLCSCNMKTWCFQTLVRRIPRKALWDWQQEGSMKSRVHDKNLGKNTI